ncbi:hypothetical protein VCHA51O444_10429 [Vibrio chagasii]|nr:hypothetical protein VCHA51O444_10429 [Vibrio chagasii]
MLLGLATNKELRQIVFSKNGKVGFSNPVMEADTETSDKTSKTTSSQTEYKKH